MDSMFDGCESLLYLPDISKWNTNNAKNMNSIFYQCKSLSSLPDISKLNTNNVIDKYNYGSLCLYLKISILKKICIKFFINIKIINPN